MYFLEWKVLFLIQISPTFVAKCTIDNITTGSGSDLVQVSDKSLPEPMMTKCYD